MKEAIKKGISLLIASAMLIGTLPAFAQEPEVETAEDVAAVETVVEDAEAVEVEEEEADEAESTTEFPEEEIAELFDNKNSGMLADLNFDDVELGDYSSKLTFADGKDGAQSFTVVDGAEVDREGRLLKITMNDLGDDAPSENQKVRLLSFGLSNAEYGDRTIVTSFEFMTDNAANKNVMELTMAGGNSGPNVCGGFRMSAGKIQVFADDAEKGNATAQDTGKTYKANEWHNVVMMTTVSTTEGGNVVTGTTYAIDGKVYKLATTEFDSKGENPNMLRFVFNKDVSSGNIYIDNLAIVDVLPTAAYYEREFAQETNIEVPDFVEYDEDTLTLPTTYKGVSLTWETSDYDIIDTDAIDANGVIPITHGEETAGATLTAFVKLDSMYGIPYPEEVCVKGTTGIPFGVTVQNKYGTENDTSKAKRIANSLVIKNTSVTEDFELPVTTTIVDSGAEISWASEDSSVIAIDGANATITRPPFDAENDKVKLTVTVKYGEATATKTVEVTVVRNEGPTNEAEDVRYAIAQLEQQGFTEAMPIAASNDLNFTTEIGNASLVWESGDTDWIANDGTIVQMPESGTGRHEVPVKVTITSGNETITLNYVISIRPKTAAKAFPGAQGYGTQTRGGAGGYIYHVTNLNAEGEGSLTYGMEKMTGARIIVFDVGGTIDLTPLGRALKLSGKSGSHVTIAGQTAPGQGIQLKGYGITLSSVEDVIIRNIKIRIGNVRKHGDTYQADPLSVSGSNKRVVLDHLSLNWGVDMGFRVDGTEVTMSNCLVSKGLYWNTPHEKGKHNYSGMFRAKYGTFYNNYLADSGQRAPRIIDNEYLDVRNNVVYNSKYSFDICNYEWMGANVKFNIVNNSVLKGDPDLSSTDGGSYKYFQGRTYSGGIFAYTANNIDQTTGTRAELTNYREGGLWTADSSYYERTDTAADELGVINAGGYSNLVSTWKNMMFPDDISMEEYDQSALSKKGNTLVNYPFPAPAMLTRTPEEATKHVLQNAGAIYPVNDTLNRRYLAEGRTRLNVRSDYSFASASQGIILTEADLAKQTDPTMAYGLPVQTHTEYVDKNGVTVYDVDGLDIANMENADELEVVKTFKFVSVAEDDVDSLYVYNANDSRKFRIVLEEYEEGDGIYDAFEVYDINNEKLEKPKDYAAIGAEDAVGLAYTLNGETHTLKFSEWGDGPGNYQHSDSYDDPFADSSMVDTEWVDSDWPMLPEVYRDTKADKDNNPDKYKSGKFDSNGDGVPDFFIELMGWDEHPDYSARKDISRMDFDDDGYTNIEEYINDYLCNDVESVDSEANTPVWAENVRDGAKKYNTHRSHEILFNTQRRAKAQVYYAEGTTLDNLEAAQRIDLNEIYDSERSDYLTATDFDTYFSVKFPNVEDLTDTEMSLKPSTTYAYRIKTYTDTGVEALSDVYTFTTEAVSSAVPSAPRVTEYIPFDKQITLKFEPSSPLRNYRQEGVSAPAGSKTVTTINAPEFENMVDHYVIRYSLNADMSDATEIKVSGNASSYTIKGLTNDTPYYIDLRAVNADGVESESALYNFKVAKELDELDKDGNKTYGVEGIQVISNKVNEYFYDKALCTEGIAPTKYVVNVEYDKALPEEGIKAGETAKFVTIFGDVKDWYIYTLGGLPIPVEEEKSENKPMLLLRDDSHEHSFTYAKTFETPLYGKSTLHSRFMISGEQLDPMNQNPEFRYYIQEDIGNEDTDADTDEAKEATVFGNIVGMSFAKNEIKINGSTVGRYETDKWYDVKILMDGDKQEYTLYINGEKITTGQYANYSEGAITAVERWNLGSRLAGMNDVYIDFMYAYTGWDEIDDNNGVEKGESGSRPTGSGSGGGGGNGTVIRDGDFDEAGKVDNTEATPVPDTSDEHVNSKFNDMGAFAWAVPAVNALHERGVVNGVGSNNFAPNRAVTRAEFITMLMRGFELIGEEATCDFTDVEKGEWCYNAIAAASAMGIVKGLPDGSFGVNTEVTRQDMTVMCLRLAQAIGLELDEIKENPSFADGNEIADYAAEAVTALYKAGIVNGTGENNFTPRGSANRAQAAKIIYEMIVSQQ